MVDSEYRVDTPEHSDTILPDIHYRVIRRHTHEAVDQVFSCVSKKLNMYDAWTISSLKTLIQESFTPSPNVMELDHVLDVQGFYETHLPC